jgi:hypothetical protein
MHRLSISPFFTWKQLLFRFFLFFFVFQKQIDQLGHSNNVERTYYCNLDCRRYVKIESCIESQKFPTRIHPQKNDFFFFFFFFCVVCVVMPIHSVGPRQRRRPVHRSRRHHCDRMRSTGMASRGRDGTNTVTVTPASAAPGAKVQIKVDATDFIGVLGAVYAGRRQGRHAHRAPPPRKTVPEQRRRDHAQRMCWPPAPRRSAWDYTSPGHRHGLARGSRRHAQRRPRRAADAEVRARQGHHHRRRRALPVRARRPPVVAPTPRAPPSCRYHRRCHHQGARPRTSAPRRLAHRRLGRRCRRLPLCFFELLTVDAASFVTFKNSACLQSVAAPASRRECCRRC